MKKTMTMVIAIATVMILTACGDRTKEQFTGINDGYVLTSREDLFTGSVKGLLNMGKKQKCIWNESGEVMGVIYTDGNKMRTESKVFILGEGGENGKTIVVNDGEWAWTWNEGAEEGMKMKNSDREMDNIEMLDIVDMKGIDIIDDFEDGIQEEIYDYKCIDWIANSKIFIPPTDIKFVDMQQMMDNMKNATTVGLDAMCDNALELKRTECLDALNGVKNGTPIIPALPLL